MRHGRTSLISAEPPIDPAIFDAAQFGIVQGMLTPERLTLHLRHLDQQFTLLAGSAASDSTLQSRAHKIVSQAGMLGLTRMTQCAQALEGAEGAGAAQAAALLQCRAAVGDVERYAMPAAERLAGVRSSAG